MSQAYIKIFWALYASEIYGCEVKGQSCSSRSICYHPDILLSGNASFDSCLSSENLTTYEHDIFFMHTALRGSQWGPHMVQPSGKAIHTYTGHNGGITRAEIHMAGPYLEFIG